jgi:hypothetical protein
MTLPRVTPLKQYSPLEVRTSPFLTQKKLVALQLDTWPCGIEHQRLVGAGIDRLEQRHDEVQPAVGIQAHVEHVLGRAADRGGAQAQASRGKPRVGHLVFGHDRDGRRPMALRGS